MTPKMMRYYTAGRSNAEFKQAVFEADGDIPPTIFESDIIKASWGLLYYGWLVGKYGEDYLRHV